MFLYHIHCNYFEKHINKRNTFSLTIKDNACRRLKVDPLRFLNIFFLSMVIISQIKLFAKFCEEFCVLEFSFLIRSVHQFEAIFLFQPYTST